MMRSMSTSRRWRWTLPRKMKYWRSFVSVEVAQLLHGALHVDRVVDAPELQVDLLLERVPVFLLVADEVDVTHEGPLRDREDDLDAALEVLDPELDVIEEPEAEDGADVLGKE